MQPIITSLLDTDFYKLLMLQLIWKKYRNVRVSFKVKNRTKDVDLNQFIDRDELIDQLQYVSMLGFNSTQLHYLKSLRTPLGNQIFCDEFIDYLQYDFKLSDVPISLICNCADLNNDIVFDGTWDRTMMWEIYVLPIINAMRNRQLVGVLEETGLDNLLYADAYIKLVKNLELIKTHGVSGISDFGTRRRHSARWQNTAVYTAKNILGDAFTGTSNVQISLNAGLQPIGTNAHELPMTLAALATNDEELRAAQYQVVSDWMELYDSSLWTVLPDTFGTQQFLKGADPQVMRRVSGIRIDSMDNVEAANLLIDYWNSIGVDPRTKVAIFSDGLTAQEIVKIHQLFNDKLICRYGWGTMLTNDFVGCHPGGIEDYLKPISLVCKVSEVNGRSAVKLSDNISKATGSVEEIERYKRVFGAVDYAKEVLV